MKKNFLVSTVFFIATYTVQGQYYHQDVLSNLQGTALSTELVNQYKPAFTLSESNMKDTLMARIYLEADGFVRGVYTQHEKPLDPNSADPNQDVFDNGQETGLNVEHIFPKNKGAKFGQAASDMHHLAPAKVNVNGDRNNLPFGELNDNVTDRWYRKAVELTNIPSSNIDEYSEWTNERFEPREDFKGNVARAMFYFYTMYQSLADNEDPAFFSAQRATLCDWHYLDPVDSLEWHRTFAIAQYQQGKANPFVLDCSVAARLYCIESSEACDRTVPTVNILDAKNLFIGDLYPNPSIDGTLFLPIESIAPLDLQLTVYDINGRRIVQDLYQKVHGKLMIPISLSKGFYLVNVQNTKTHTAFSKKIVVP